MDAETVKKRVLELIDSTKPFHDMTIGEIFKDGPEKPFQEEPFARRKDTKLSELLFLVSARGSHSSKDPDLHDDVQSLAEIRLEPFNPLLALWNFYEAAVRSP